MIEGEAPAVGRELAERVVVTPVLRRITVVCTLGGLLFGYDTGVINGALLYLQRDLGLGPVGEGLVTSALLIGAAAGALLAGHMADLLGRRRNILILSLLFIAGTLCSAAAPGAVFLGLSRFALGIAVGGASVTVPTFLAEMAPVGRRGRLVTINELMIVSGQLLAFVLNAVLGLAYGQHAGIWRWMLGLAVVPAVALLLGMLFVPESPRWLAKHGRNDEALAVLRRIRTEPQARTELEGILRLTAEAEEAQTDASGLRVAWMRRVLFVGLGIGICQQITGINSIMYYGTQILTASGLGRDGALVANVSNGVVSVLATFGGIALLPKVDRRRLFTIGLCGTTLSLLAIGLISVLLPNSTGRAIAVLAAMAAFLVAQQGFVSPVTWVMLSEVFPLRIRGIAFGLSGLTLWLVNFVIALVFPSLTAAVGVSGTFFVFVALGIGGLWFVRHSVPET
ncbi:MAG: sugar porter family MFS transporter, partial [Gluconacetobacter diazotrophicus]|nr:sugar porter family MFS transporter [Gluconacetobacter diazotrophicus]